MRESISKMFRAGSGGVEERNNTVTEVDIVKIKANPFQPRKFFDPIQMKELAKSIEEYGVIQPIIVRKNNDYYELVAGERRLRASQSIGMEKIPAIIKEYNNNELAEIALIENLQREDLNYFEEAEGYRKLITEFELTQEEVAKRVGKSQSTIANKLRLLKLPEETRKNISPEVVTERHARALLKIKDTALQISALKEIYENELNVRETDMLVDRVIKSEEGGGEKETGKRIVRIFKDMRIYLNTIRSAVKAIKSAGIDVRMQEKEYDEHIEVLIKIPKGKG